MEIDSLTFPPSFEDYSHFFPEMEQPNVNPKKRNHPEDSSQSQLQWESINPNNNNNCNDTNSLNDFLNTLIRFDTPQQQIPTTQQQQQQQQQQ